MKNRRRMTYRISLLVTLAIVLTAASARIHAQYELEDMGTCGGQSITLPFTDVAGNTFFCTIAAAYFSGLTNGTTSTTYGPQANVTRDQMSAFITRTLDQSLKRGSQRAALDQFWTPQTAGNLALTTVGNPHLVKSDGADLWVANQNTFTVSRVRAGDGKLLETWTGATNAFGVLVAMGKVFVTGYTSPGKLYQIDPTQTAGMVATVSSSLGVNPAAIAFDGQRIWTANDGTGPNTGSVSIITSPAFTVTTVSTGFNQPAGMIFDGANIWVTDIGDDKLKKLNSDGSIALSVNMGRGPLFPVFDGTNIWVPNATSHSISVVRATGGLAGTVLATLTGNGLNSPYQAAFDGERILVTNFSGDSVSLWRASDLTPLGTFPTGASTTPFGACSDGLNFWIALASAGKLARF